MSEIVTQLSQQNFQTEVLESTTPVLIDFWAEWCGPCLALGPVLEQVARERAGKVKVCKLNVEEAPELSAHFNVRALPNLVFLKNGKKVDELIGNQSKQRILKTIDTIANS